MRAYLIASLLTTLCAAQDFPPPPLPDGVQTAFEALKQTVLAIGRVDYSYTMRPDANSPAQTVSTWSRVRSVAFDRRGCRMRAQLENPKGTTILPPLFLEYVESVEAKDSALSINGVGFPGLAFANHDQAARTAEAIRLVAQRCQAAPSAPDPESGPELAETLRFIAEKLNEIGTVRYQVTDDSPQSFSTSDTVISATADAATCDLRYKSTSTYEKEPADEFDRFIPFGSMAQVEVSATADVLDRLAERDGKSHRYFVAPPVYEISVPGWGVEIPFYDEDTATRVAQAMAHAAELCSTSNKESF